MIKGFSNGFKVMQEKEQLSDKLGKFHSSILLLVSGSYTDAEIYSNVVAATDLTLLALAGIGLHYQKARIQFLIVVNFRWQKFNTVTCQGALGAVGSATN